MSEVAREREARIITKATEVLADRHVGDDSHRFLLSAVEAETIGQAIASRNYQTLNNTIGKATDAMVATYEDTAISGVQASWETSLHATTGLEGDSLEFIQSSTHRQALINHLQHDTYGDELDLEPNAYIKMLETFAFATAPDVTELRERHYTSRSARRSPGEQALFARAMTTLITLADQEPGIGIVREHLLDNDASGFNLYLRRYSMLNLARQATASIYQASYDGELQQQRERVRHELGSLPDDEELLLTHILNWTMLPPEISEQRNKTAVRKLAMDRAVSDYQRQRLEEHWSDERIDLIFDIARLGTESHRQPNIYISSTFDNGAGLYLAVGLTHPRDKSKQIVVADNPVNGNALYFVDELLTKTDHDNRPYAWQEVLGARKHIARERGATRRYHTGDWVQVAHAVCEYTSKPAPMNPVQAATPAPSEAAPKPAPGAPEQLSTEEVIRRFEQATAAARVAIERARQSYIDK